ncbi:SIP domain-containing protein [Brachybacterium hainanense]|uniref:SIP domain-containing protein n=1 Tax=Brachybacterium hainanense TaxID=1541174 RepID=A0ABV6R696_9MICO
MQSLPERYLMIGDESDLPLLRAMLEQFPDQAAGSIYLEMPDGISPRLPHPAGITLTYLHRGGTARGVRSVEALDAWTQEWVCAAGAAPDMHAAWVGLEGCAAVDLACARLGSGDHAVHLHRPWSAGCDASAEHVRHDHHRA